jgi:hypothetical protein
VSKNLTEDPLDQAHIDCSHMHLQTIEFEGLFIFQKKKTHNVKDI